MAADGGDSRNLPPDIWSTVDVSDWMVADYETAGSNDVTWLRSSADAVAWLHKDTHVPVNGHEQGEDWSEVISTQIAGALGVPCAETRLCVRNGRRGSISKSLNRDGYSFVNGGDWMVDVGIEGYRPTFGRSPDAGQQLQQLNSPRVVQPGHTVENIRTALSHVGPPLVPSLPDDLCAFDVFAGYLVLDALVANRDRHERNWAVLRSELSGASDVLSPSFDHGTSLGYNLTDAKRESVGVEKFAFGGTAWRFEHTGKCKTTLVELAGHALALSSDSGRAYWCERVAALDLAPVVDALAERRIEHLSVVASRFITELLDTNLRRLRDVVGTS